MVIKKTGITLNLPYTCFLFCKKGVIKLRLQCTIPPVTIVEYEVGPNTHIYE